MRIGLFTDTYFPAMNGITYVVDGVRQQLQKQGHEVYVFAPAESVKGSIAHLLKLRPRDPYVIRFASVDASLFFENMRASFFFTPRMVGQIRELELDVVHFFTPGQIGLLGVHAAKKLDIPLVGQHCTDLFQYVEYYPAVLPGILALSLSLPFSLPHPSQTFKDIFTLLRPRRIQKWNKDIVKEAMTLVYNQCDAVIVPSRKIHTQLSQWHITAPMTIMPNGVDALPKPNAKELAAFLHKYQLAKEDNIIMYAGRLSPEKNLELLIDVLVKVRKQVDGRTVLLYVGASEHQEVLEEYARKKGCIEDVRFTGRIPREKLGIAYAVATVFAFPSQTDTQGLVLHEAAQASLPLVVIDAPVTEVLEEGKNGFVANANATSMAKKIITILQDPTLQRQFGRKSKQIAARYTEAKQAVKLEKLYKGITS